AGLMTSEAGGLATFDVVLHSQPTADVIIPIASDNAAEGAASPASLTFTAADWNVAQTVTVTGADDHVQDGEIAYHVVLGAASTADPGPPPSPDPTYAGRDPADAGLPNPDTDVAGAAVTPVAGLATSEAGGSATFSVVLESQPVADVVIPVASDNAAEGVASPAS